MSEKSSGDDIRLKCLSTVLRCCIGTDVAKIEALATLLRDDDIITTRDERRAFAKLARAGKSNDAIELMITKVSTSQHGIKFFATALEDEDLKVDKRFSEVLAAVLAEECTNETKTKLVSLWGELVSFQQDIKPVVEEMWPNQTDLITEPWPLHFIYFCVTTQDDDLQKVEDFVSSVNFLPPQAETAKDVNLPDDQQDEFLSEPPPLSIETDEPESFVVVNEEGEEEGNERTSHTSITSPASAEVRHLTVEAPDGESEGNQGGTSGASPMLTSTESQQILNQRIEEVINKTVDSPGPSITYDKPPAVYVSEESSLATSEASIQQSPNGEETISQTPNLTDSPGPSITDENHPVIYAWEEGSRTTSEASIQQCPNGEEINSLTPMPTAKNLRPQKAEDETRAPISQDGIQGAFGYTGGGGQEDENEEIDALKQELPENLLPNDEDDKSKHTTADEPSNETGQKESRNAEKNPTDDEHPSGFTDLYGDIPGGDQDEVTNQAHNDTPTGGSAGNVSGDVTGYHAPNCYI